MSKYDELCKKIISSYPQVRFAGVANSKGELTASSQRDGIEKMLTPEDEKMSIHYALQKRELFTNLAYKIGSETSSVTEYEKVTLISIPISSSELFLMSTEPRADYFKVIDFVRDSVDTMNRDK